MPYTPLHFGPSGFIGLLFRRWLDLPVFLLANIIIDLEVWVAAYMKVGPLSIRYGHTLLIATAAGLLWGAAAYPLKKPFRWAMGRLRLPYETSFTKMILSGMLGAWVHILVDGLYRSNVVLFWPSRIRNPLCRYDKTEVETFCIVLGVAAFALYGIIRHSRTAKKEIRP